MLDLSKFQAQGRETCFHGRHIGAQIYDGLDGRNWRLRDYVARWLMPCVPEEADDGRAPAPRGRAVDRRSGIP